MIGRQIAVRHITERNMQRPNFIQIKVVQAFDAIIADRCELSGVDRGSGTLDAKTTTVDIVCSAMHLRNSIILEDTFIT